MSMKQPLKASRKTVKSEIDELYQTTCPKCGGKAHAICTYWHNDEATDIRNLVCPVDGMVRGKVLDSKDKENLESIKKKDVPFGFLEDKLQYSNGKDFKEGTHINGLDSVPSLFTHRNLIALALLNNEIESITKQKYPRFNEVRLFFHDSSNNQNDDLD